MRYRKAGLNIVQCRQCGLVYVNPRWAQADIWKRYNSTYFWEEYLPANNAAQGRVDLAFHDCRARPILDLAQPYHQEGRLLDVGCAAGFFLKAANRAGWGHVCGVEIMQEAVDFACARLGLNVLCGTLEWANYSNDFFDVVVMQETIEHLLDPRAVLREVYRITRPGGALILTTPNLDSLAGCLFGVDWSVLGPGEHLYYFTTHTLACMLRTTGFRQVRFAWLTSGISWTEIINPFNVTRPYSWRSRLVKRLISMVGPFVYRGVAKLHRSDTLYALAEK